METQIWNFKIGIGIDMNRIQFVSAETNKCDNPHLSDKNKIKQHLGDQNKIKQHLSDQTKIKQHLSDQTQQQI